jgi:hypothetical protein
VYNRYNKETNMPVTESVSVSLGFTQNLGNYESLRVAVTRGKEGIPEGQGDAAAAELYALAEAQLIAEAKEIHANLSGDASRKTTINP